MPKDLKPTAPVVAQSEPDPSLDEKSYELSNPASILVDRPANDDNKSLTRTSASYI